MGVIMNGYELAEEVFHNIGLNEKHEISTQDMVRVMSLFGYNDESERTTMIGFVCYCARETLKKILEKALVFGDYGMYDNLIKSIDEYRIASRKDDNNAE